MLKLCPKQFRIGKGCRAWNTSFVGMYSHDAGGPYRNAIDGFCIELMSPVLPLFMLCPNGVADVGNNRDMWIPRSTSTRESLLKQYEFVGQLMGLAIRTGWLLSLNCPGIFWKQLVEQKVTDSDVLDIDLMSLQIIGASHVCPPSLCT